MGKRFLPWEKWICYHSLHALQGRGDDRSRELWSLLCVWDLGWAQLWPLLGVLHISQPLSRGTV